MPAYDSSFDPPAPVADVSVLHPDSGRASGRLRGKLDIAADLTVIPLRLVSELRLNHKGHCWTKGYDGTLCRRPVYYVRLKLDEFDLTSVRCVATERNDVLVGRNVLNRFLLVLDGMNLAYELRPT
jgi:hypothetical protein